MPQFGLLENNELQSLLETYGTKASEKEITRRLGEGAKQQSMESLLAALIGTPQAQQAQGQAQPQTQPQAQAQPQAQPEPEQPEPGSFWRKLGTALMMGGAGLQGQDPSAVLKNLMEAQQMGQLQPGEKEKLGIEQANYLERLATEYGYKKEIEGLKQGVELESSAVGANIFQNDLINMVSAFEAIPIKGKGLGGISALAGAVNIGKRERQKFETLSEAFVYSFASYIAQQQGRALDKDEVKRFREIVKLKTGDTRSSVEGKIQGIIDLANTRSRQLGRPELPDVKTLLSQIKQTKAQKQTSNNLSGIQDELDMINRRLKELGD